MEMFQSLGVADEIAKNGTEIGLFAVISHRQFATLLTIIGLILVATFFVSSADSSIVVVSMHMSNGSL